MTFDEILAQVLALLEREKRLSYRALKVRFALVDDHLEALKEEIIEAKQLAVDEHGKVLVGTGSAASPAPPAPASEHAPRTYTPPYLAEKILTSRSALEGERKQVTVLFADLKGSVELPAEYNPDHARQLFDPVLTRVKMTVCHLLTRRTPFRDLSAEEYAQRAHKRDLANLRKSAEKFGLTLVGSPAYSTHVRSF